MIDDELLPPEEYDAGHQFIELAKTLCVDEGGHYVGATVERLEEMAAALMRVVEVRVGDE